MSALPSEHLRTNRSKAAKITKGDAAYIAFTVV